MFCLSRPLMFKDDVVTWLGLLGTLVVHLDGEHLSCARIGGGVGGKEDNLLTRLHETLLDTACEDITDTLNLVDAGDWHPHWGAGWSLWHAAHLVKEIVQDLDHDLLAAGLNLDTAPPRHVELACRVLRLQEIVAHPAGDWEEWHVLLNHVLLPADLDKHALHLVGDLLVSGLLVTCGVAVHLVAAADDLLHAQQIDETGVLTSLALDLTGLVVALGNGSGEITVAWHHDHGDISLGGTGNHVLDEIAVTWGINDGVVPLVSEEFLGGARDGHTALTLLLLPVHVKGECKTALAKALGLLLELLQFTLGDSAKLKNQTTGGGALATVDVSADDDGKMLLLGIGRHDGTLYAAGCADQNEVL